MSKDMHTTFRLSYEGGVDTDGHILEPPDLWETYIDPEFRDRAMRIVRDENGLEELEIDGKRSEMTRMGSLSILGAMGEHDVAKVMFDPERTYLTEAPYGSMDAAERIQVLDAENIDAAVIYTTVGLLWEAEVKDPALAQAYTKAYNRWVTEWCSYSPRLIPAAHLSLSDPVAAATELERAVGEGARGCYVAPFTHDAKAIGHPDHDPVFQMCQDLDVPFAIHPTFEPQWTKGTRMGDWQMVKQRQLLPMVQASDGVRHQWVTLIDGGVLDRFPKLKVLILESGGGWLGYYLDRMDGVYGHTPLGNSELTRKPSDYFREQCWISCDPDERSIADLASRYGADRFSWASDFPHIDHTNEYIKDLDELAGMFPEGRDRQRFLGDNIRELFKIDPTAKVGTP